jgi:hypothetical protein
VWRRLHHFLAGTDGTSRTALPLGEFLHPVPLVALIVLAVNDHYWKGAGVLPGWLTGKLSDFAGLLFFPLLLTSLADTLLYGVVRVTGWKLDPTLRAWKIWLGCLATAAVFAPLELSAAYGRFYTETLGKVGFPSETVADLTDLYALVMIPLAGWLGYRELQRVPLGRMEQVAAGRMTVEDALRDVPDSGELAAAMHAWITQKDAASAARVDALLAARR